MSTVPNPVAAAIHGPYEDLGIEGLKVIQLLIEGMTPEQKATVWQNWINFWQPLMDLGKTLGVSK